METANTKKSVTKVVIDSLKRSTARQHGKDKASFEENRGKNSFARAKEQAAGNFEKNRGKNSLETNKGANSFARAKEQAAENWEKGQFKNSLAGAKEQAAARHAKATEPNPDFEEFKDAVKSKFTKKDPQE